MRKISYCVWCGTQPGTGKIVEAGEATMKELQGRISDRNRWIVSHREEITYEHLVYAVKFLDKSGDVYAVNFYELQLDDEQFDRVAAMKNCIVYAYHTPRCRRKENGYDCIRE